MSSRIVRTRFWKAKRFCHLERIIQTGDIGAVKNYIQDNNLTHARLIKKTDHWLMYEIEDVYPVTVAAKCGEVDILNYLLSIGFCHTFGWQTTPMLEACKHGHVAVVKVLIELHGVDVNEIYFPKSDCLRETALSTAASAGRLEIVQYLLEMGASVEPVYKQRHMTPLHAAVTGRDVRIVKILSQYMDVDIAVKPGCMTPLTFAASFANGEILTALLDAGADIEGNKTDTSTPFGRAVFSGKLENAKLLYSKGANPETRRNSGHCTPLEIAIQGDNYEMVRYLAVELNLPWDDNQDRGPLDLAFHHNRALVIKLLIDAGFSSSVKNREVSNRRIVPDTVICELNVFLEQTSSNIRTLMEICCFKVRSSLGRNLSRGVDTIPLPRPLIDFVKLTRIPLHISNVEDI